MERDKVTRKEKITLDGDDFISLIKTGTIENSEMVIEVSEENRLSVLGVLINS